MPSNESLHDVTINIDPGQYAFKERKLRVVCIGAGFSGLILAHKLKHEDPLDFVHFTIYEKNCEVGGAWLENVYPGVGCDVPAHSYVFPFEPNPNWSKCYAGGAEIEKYIVDTVDKYGLKDPIVFDTKLVKSIWNEERGKWVLELKQNDKAIHDEADILINGSGILNQWKMPNIVGLDQFAGKLVHTAAWDKTYDWTGKNIAPKAARIVNYIRHPTWASVNLCPDITKDGSGTNFEYSEEEKAKFREYPQSFLDYRKRVDCSVNTVYRLTLSGSEHNQMLFDAILGLMRQRLSENPDLIDKLIPKFEIGCRRLSPGDGYLEALQQPNAEWCFEGIEEFTKTDIRTAAGEEEFDLIVCPTGFDTTIIPGWELVAREGGRFDVEWKKTPEAYFSICAGGIPNYFMFNGPNCPIGQGSVPQMISWTADYMLK
ncbi:hypothetical protein N7471_012646 [Penicillium samsonianum]|uniref:uncharacterized protein n=1 Tax=Penicillium samsonianum TaxID=1882272 RepID=UPI002548C6A3|nr:uncharacterized protein N7471_012646 [Penicillium samsonianum]KAJ6125329.1 hypothetical protein N7471_012646 [Penicillium samsonianum]